MISQYLAVTVLSGVSNVDNTTDLVLLNICTTHFTTITEIGVGETWSWISFGKILNPLKPSDATAITLKLHVILNKLTSSQKIGKSPYKFLESIRLMYGMPSFHLLGPLM